MDERNLKINLDKHALWAPAIVGLAIIVATTIGAYSFYLVRSFDNALSVTGSAKTSITSDRVKWGAQITRTVYESQLKFGYNQLAQDKLAVEKFLKDQGIKDEDLIESAVFMDQMYDYNPQGVQRERQYTLRQTFEINSTDVLGVTKIAKNTGALINQGILFSTYTLEYSYSKLADLRVSLLADAIKDAKARAAQIATASGKNVGQLKSASSGVVQVLSRDSVEVSDYGTYDTSKIEKDIMVTVRASFTLR